MTIRGYVFPVIFCSIAFIFGSAIATFGFFLERKEVEDEFIEEIKEAEGGKSKPKNETDQENPPAQT